MALETFGAAVDERFEGLRVVHVHHVHECGVDPASGFDAVETTYYQFELHVVFFVFVLNLTVVRGDLDARYTSFNECCCTFGFRFAHIGLPKEELSIQIGYIDSVHVDDVNVFEAGKS